MQELLLKILEKVIGQQIIGVKLPKSIAVGNDLTIGNIDIGKIRDADGTLGVGLRSCTVNGVEVRFTY